MCLVTHLEPWERRESSLPKKVSDESGIYNVLRFLLWYCRFMSAAKQKRTRARKHTIASVTMNARKYESRVAWARAEPAIYRAARRLAKEHGEEVFDMICRDAEFVVGGYKPIIWTHRSVLYEMRKYENFSQFRRNALGAYQAYRTKYKELLRTQLPEEYFKRKKYKSASWTG